MGQVAGAANLYIQVCVGFWYLSKWGWEHKMHAKVCFVQSPVFGGLLFCKQCNEPSLLIPYSDFRLSWGLQKDPRVRDLHLWYEAKVFNVFWVCASSSSREGRISQSDWRCRWALNRITSKRPYRERTEKDIITDEGNMESEQRDWKCCSWRWSDGAPSQGCQQPEESPRDKERPLPWRPQKNLDSFILAQDAGFRRLASRTVKKYSSVVFSHKYMVICYRSHRKWIQVSTGKFSQFTEKKNALRDKIFFVCHGVFLLKSLACAGIPRWMEQLDLIFYGMSKEALWLSDLLFSCWWREGNTYNSWGCFNSNETKCLQAPHKVWV